MAESTQKKLTRVRPDRVTILYEVETEGATVKKELPFVVGVVGDFSGQPTEPLKPLRDRKFIEIDRDNIDDVMARMTPGLNIRVENTLAGDGSELGVALKFKSMQDFEPGRVVDQVEPLRELKAARDRLKQMQAQVDRSPEIEEDLEKIIRQTQNK